MAVKKPAAKKTASPAKKTPSRAKLISEGKKLIEAGERVLNLAGSVKAPSRNSPTRKPAAKKRSTKK